MVPLQEAVKNLYRTSAGYIFEGYKRAHPGISDEEAQRRTDQAMRRCYPNLCESVANNTGFSAEQPVSQKGVLTTYKITTKRGSFYYQARNQAEIEAWAIDYVAGFIRAEAIADPSPLSKESLRVQRRTAQQVELREAYGRFVASGRI